MHTSLGTTVSRRILAVLSAAILAVALTGGPAHTEDENQDTYEQEMAQWRQTRDERLRSPKGYLALVGLHWLVPGENTFGGAESNDIRFTSKGLPSRIGTFTLKDGAVTVTIAPGVEVLCDSTLVTSMRLYADTDPDHETQTLRIGDVTWYVLQRGDKIGIRVRDPQSPTLAAFKGVDNFPVERGWRKSAKLERYPIGKTIKIANEIDVESDEACVGAIVFEHEGKTYRLDALGEPGADSYFVIFGDQTNGFETYGAGRFLVVDAADDDGNVVIDFNKAYDPPCAFSEFTTCPLPPMQNRLPIKVTAGEKAYEPHASASTH